MCVRVFVGACGAEGAAGAFLLLLLLFVVQKATLLHERSGPGRPVPGARTMQGGLIFLVGFRAPNFEPRVPNFESRAQNFELR